MASCKDCLHVDVCRGIYLAIISGEINSYEEFLEKCEKEHFEKQDISPCNCLFYKGRSRFVELPCKVGDTVYVLSKQIVCDTVDGIAIEKFPDSSIPYQIYCEKSRATYEFKDFGKIIFLDPESAEQALKERENNENQ